MEEELKNKNAKVEKVAGEENKDKDSLAYDQNSHRLIDIDDILLGDFKIAQKFNNLSEYGVTTEQVKKMYEMSGDISSEQSLEDILKELEKVFAKLVSKINSNSNIGIVIDLNSGKEDVELSKIKCIDLGIEYGSYEDKTLQEKAVEIEKIFLSDKEEEKENYSDLDKYLKIVNNEKTFDSILNNRNYTEDDLKKASKILETTEEEEEEVKRNIEKTYLDNPEDINVIEAVYELTKILDKKVTEEKREEAINNFRRVLDENPNSSYIHQLIDDNNEFDVENVKEFKENWQKQRNLGDIAVKINQCALISNFEELSKEDKEEILLVVARATKYSDNPYIEKALLKFKENFGLDISKEGIKKLIYEITDIKIETDEEFNKYIEKDEFNDNTVGFKLEEYREDIQKNKGKGLEAEQYESLIIKRCAQKKENYDRTVKARKVYKLFNEKFKNNIGNASDYLPIEIIMLFEKFSNNDSMKKIIGRYIIENVEIFDKYFKENGYFNENQIQSILTSKGTVRIRAVNQVLKNVMLPEYIKNDVDDLTDVLEEIKKEATEKENSEEKNIEKIHNLINNPNEFTPQKENTVLKILANIDEDSIPEWLLRELTKLKSSKIKEKLDEMLTSIEDMENLKQIRKAEDVEDEKIEKNVFLIEAKVELAKGTPDYASALEYRRKYYEENQLAQKKAEKYRDKNGELNEEGKKKIENYVNELVNENIKYVIEKTDVNSLTEDKKRLFTTFLIAGFEVNSLDTKIIAIDKLQTMYASLGFEIDNREFRKKVYSKVYGNGLELDDATIEQKAKEIRSNLINKVIKEKEPIEIIKKENPSNSKISDQEIETIYKNQMVDIDASAIDLTQSEMKNLFRNSKMNFSDENDKKYKDLYIKTTIASWIGNKDDVLKYKLLALMQVRENFQNYKGVLFGITNLKVINHQIEMLFNQHPEIREKYVKDGKISKSLMDEGRRFNENKICSKILEKFSKNVLKNASNFENLKKEEKVEILRYTLLARKYSEISNDPKEKDLLLKLSNRTFELMNTDETKYITFDNNGKEKINEEAIVKEYNKISMRRMRRETFDEIKELVYQRESLLYVSKKMREYSQRKETDFIELDSKNPEEQIAQIEQIKFLKNQEYDAERKKRKDEIAKEIEEKSDAISDFSKERIQQNPNEIKEISRKITDSRESLIESENGEEKQDTEKESKKLEVSVEDIEIEGDKSLEVEEDKGILKKIKNFIKRVRQPKLSDGTNSLENKNGILANLALKVKNMFSKGGKKENLKNDNITIENARNSQIEYSNSQKDFNQRMQVQNYDYQSALDKTNKSKRMEKVQSEDKDFGGI